jgi:hypothetical protein
LTLGYLATTAFERTHGIGTDAGAFGKGFL